VQCGYQHAVVEVAAGEGIEAAIDHQADTHRVTMVRLGAQGQTIGGPGDLVFRCG
jgi:hypothetical protein